MGITRNMFDLLINEAKSGRFKGKTVLQLGRQTIFFSPKEALIRMRNMGFHSPEYESFLNKRSLINDEDLFRLLGFSVVESIDYSSYEGATHIWDLNLPIPEELKERYDLVFDGGTMEHVFNPIQVLANVHDLLRPDGIIIHQNPVHNYVDHGYFTFSPTFFYEYYEANKYKIMNALLLECNSLYSKNWRTYRYTKGLFAKASNGVFGKKLITNWFEAQKQLISTKGVVPQQSIYTIPWIKGIKKDLPKNRIREFLKKIPFLFYSVVRIRECKGQKKCRDLLRSGRLS